MTPQTSIDPDDLDPSATPDTDPIPPIDTAELPFSGTDELRQRWRALMGPLGFDEPKLWFVFVEHDTRLIPVINTLPLPVTPNRHLIEPLMARLGETIEVTYDLSIACLLTRPGSDGLTTRDRGWASLLTSAAIAGGVPLQPLFRANDVNLITVPSAIVPLRSTTPDQQAS